MKIIDENTKGIVRINNISARVMNEKRRKMEYARIRPKGLNFITVPIADISEYLKNSEPGEMWEVELIEMTDDEYSELPEGKGF